MADERAPSPNAACSTREGTELSQAVRVVAQCRDWDITSHTPIALASLGHVYAWSGRIEEGASPTCSRL
jgi:hypothetical protein